MGSFPRELLYAVLIEIAAVAVIEHGGRKALDLEPADGLGAEILVGHHVELLDEAREHGPGPADGAEVHRLVLLERGLDGLGARALAQGPLEAQGEERGCELVHPPTRCWPDRAHDLARPGRRGPCVIDDLALDVDGQRLARSDER